MSSRPVAGELLTLAEGPGGANLGVSPDSVCYTSFAKSS
jgi:hypothetical protein